MIKIFCLLVLASFNISNASTVFNKNVYFDTIRLSNDKIILYYKDFDVYMDSFEFNNLQFKYIIDGDKNILFFDEDGRKIVLDINLFVLKNYSEQFKGSTSKSSAQALVYSKVLDAENYDVLPEPLMFDKNELFSKITSSLSDNCDYKTIPENTRGVTKFQFDIDENGLIVNVKYLSEVEIDGLDYVVKFLYGLDKWSPAKINGKPVKSTYEIKLFSSYNADIIPADELSQIIKSLQ